jgi:hypothetical protein
MDKVHKPSYSSCGILPVINSQILPSPNRAYQLRTYINVTNNFVTYVNTNYYVELIP